MSSTLYDLRHRPTIVAAFEWLDQGEKSAAPSSGFFAIEAESEALRAAAGFYEFVERSGDRFVSARGDCGVQLVAARVGDNVPTDDDGVACEALGLGLFHLD